MLKDFIEIKVQKGNWKNLEISRVETNLKDIRPKPKEHIEEKVIIPNELI